ncbi:hypothetical protein ES708_20464 [subsurface metagenome]
MIRHHADAPGIVGKYIAKHLVPLVPGKVHVYIRWIASLVVEKAIEVEIMAQRIHVGDSQQIADQTGGGTPPAAGPRTTADNIPYHQEVPGKTLAADHLKLVIQTLFPQGRRLCCGAPPTKPSKQAEGLGLGQTPVPGKDVLCGQEGSAFRLFCDSAGCLQGFRHGGEIACHLTGVHEVLMGLDALRGGQFLDRTASGDAAEQVADPIVFPVHAQGIVHRQSRQAARSGEPEQLAEGQAVGQLHVQSPALPPAQALQKPGIFTGQGKPGPPLGQQVLQKIALSPVGDNLVQPDKTPSVQNIGGEGPTSFPAQGHSDYRADTFPLGGLQETNQSVEVVSVHQPDGPVPPLLRPATDGLGSKKAVSERKTGGEMKEWVRRIRCHNTKH